MNRIIILDENTANQIAAGEVIERPASVVKELVENSIDAGSKSIKIEISRGGISLIRISDDGSGIPAEDVEMAFERHGTSKIRSAKDLEGIATMGFRGEALPSIASVSKVEMNTSVGSGEPGVRIRITGGRIEEKEKSARRQGTSITVRNLFFNTPARYKFLKNDTNEARYCTDIVSRLALAHTEVSFRYFSNGTEVLRTPGDGNLKNAVYCVYGREIAENVFDVSYEDDVYCLSGFTGNRLTARGNRQNQTVFVNGRYIKSKEVVAAVEKAYETEIMKGKFPFYIININFDPHLVDVNVHPAKSEVRFAQGNNVFAAVYSAIRAALDSGRGVAEGVNLQAKIKRDITYYDSVNEPVNMSFLSDNDRSGSDGLGMKSIHEPLITKSSPVYNQVIESHSEQINEEFTQHESKGIDILDKGSFLGILFKTFIMIEISDIEVLLIDQHAAHERITYEGLLNRFKNKDMNSQVLLKPDLVNLQPFEAVIAEENDDFLKNLGFDFDFVGSRDIVIRAIPSEITQKDSGDVFKGALEGIAANAGKEHILIEKEAIYTMACKSSIKANTELNSIEVRSLIDRLKLLENPYTCPHGRPVIVKLNRRELEKLFKRII